MALTDKAKRDKRLDELAEATTEWAAAKKQRLEKEAAFGKALLKGRTDAERLNNEVVNSAANLLVDELNDFLTGL